MFQNRTLLLVMFCLQIQLLERLRKQLTFQLTVLVYIWVVMFLALLRIFVVVSVSEVGSLLYSYTECKLQATIVFTATEFSTLTIKLFPGIIHQQLIIKTALQTLK